MASMLVVALVVAPGSGVSSGDLQVSLDTLGCVSACFAAGVALERSRRLVSPSSRIVVVALVVAAASVVLFVALPTLLGAVPGRSLRFARTLLNVACAALLVWAALVPRSLGGLTGWQSRLAARILPERRLVALAVALSLAVGGIGIAIGGLASPRALDVGYACAGVAFLAAATALAFRAPRSLSPAFAWWLVVSSILAAGATFAIFLHGASAPHDVSPAVVMRMGSLLALGAGALGELRAMRGRERVHATHEERRRVASELHDGVAQELSFIAVQTRHLATRYPDAPGLNEIRDAAELALEDCRSAIAGLRHAAAPTLALAIECRARALASRAGLELTLDVADDVVTSGEAQHEVLSIIREALSNIARHSGASRVAISLSSRQGVVVVRISDNGRGFEPPGTASRNGGFGLTSMRERAQRLGGEFVLDSRPGDGTTIEVSIP